MEKAVVLCSGGLNSAVLLGLAKQSAAVAALHVRIPHRAAAREASLFDKLAAHFDVPERLVVDMPHFGAIGGNARVDSQITIEDAVTIRRTPSTCYVPGLIGTLLSAGYSWATAIGARQVWLGVSENLGPPSPPTAAMYPDYSREFIQAFEQVFVVPSLHRPITIEAPLIDLSRGDIVQLGVRMEVPFKQTWSCLAGGEEPCQRCVGCATRARGFAMAGTPDPIMPVARVR